MVRDSLMRGRHWSAQDVEQTRPWLGENRSWFRTRLSRELCELWEWRNGAGRLKDMACRTLLLKLEARGFIRLPPRQAASSNGWRNRSPEAMAHETTVRQAPLAALGSLRVAPVPSGSAQAK